MKRFLTGFVPFLLLAALLATGILYTESQRTAESLQKENEALLQRVQSDTENAARTLSEALNDLQSDLRKLGAAASRGQHVRLLADVWRLSGVAGSALESLPVSHTDGSGLMQFLTRIGDYAYALLQSAEEGTLPTATDAEQLQKIGEQCAALQKAVDGRISNGTLPTDPVTPQTYYTASAEKDAVPAYPTLLYDGPFSESSENAEPVGLPERTVSEAEAKAIASAAGGAEWRFDGICESAIRTYDFSGPNGESLSVTERGGKILYRMEPPSGDKNDPPSDAESREMHAIASAYLESAGYGTMHPSYAQYYAGCVVLNYAAVQDGVVLYSDLVKVYVDREAGRVIGIDARNYWSHHTHRELEPPALTAEDAKNAVSTELTVEAVTLALIPKSNVREVLCYECKGTLNDTFFLIYINAQTGVEEEIFEVINTEEGDLIV